MRLGLERLNGFSHHQQPGAIRDLTYYIDLWIEKNTDLIRKVTISKDFAKKLEKEVGYLPTIVTTLVGDPTLSVTKQKNPISIYR